MQAKKKVPTSSKDAIMDMFILAPAATFPWVPIHVFHLTQETQRWDIHISYVALWVLFLIASLIVRRLRFKTIRAPQNTQNAPIVEGFGSILALAVQS